MATIELKSLSKGYGHHKVLNDLDLTIEEGEFVTIVGPSGCGKSTLLRILAGLESITGGDLYFDGGKVNEVPPKERGVAMVFQSYALYPHLSVFKNVAFGLKGRIAPEKIKERVDDVLARLQLSHLSTRLPKQLSGGQRQRVAIARAISREPGVMLFDEPLSNLDAGLRTQTRMEIAKLHRNLGSTTVYVTHDQVEAMTLSDKIVILNAGKIEQVGTPLELYRRPANRFVAEFIGSPKINVLSKEEGLKLFAGSRTALIIEAAGDVEVAVRAHEVRIAAIGEGHLSGTVSVIEAFGDRAYLYVDVDGGKTAIAVEASTTENLGPGDRVALATRTDSPLLFDRVSGRLTSE